MHSTNDTIHSITQGVAESQKPIELAGSRLDNHCHICAFFHSKEEEYPVLLPFIKEGIERGEKAFHVVDPKLRKEHLHYLESVGIETEAVEQSGQLELRNWHEAYLLDGHFDQNRMLAMLQSVLDEARQEGFPLTRLVAHMEWALEDRPGVNDIVEYETRLNYFLHKYSDPVVCVYDLAQFGACVIDILRTHPMVIIGGVLQENPFFVPPDDFLSELRKRQNRNIHSVAS
ncbi:MAG: MEDS domain-containing protein [Gammaproteobacteria bacterium]